MTRNVSTTYWDIYWDNLFFFKQDITEELQTYANIIEGLHKQASELGEQVNTYL